MSEIKTPKAKKRERRAQEIEPICEMVQMCENGNVSQQKCELNKDNGDDVNVKMLMLVK